MFKARIWMPDGGRLPGEFRVEAMTARLELGAPARLDLTLNRNPGGGLKFGARLALVHGEDRTSEEKKFATVQASYRVVSVARADSPGPVAGEDGMYMIWQRGEDESVGEFVMRATGEQEEGLDWEPAALTWVESALPIASCVAAPESLPVEQRLDRILAAAGARSNRAARWCGAIAGPVRLIVDDSQDSRVALDAEQWVVEGGPLWRDARLVRLIVEDPEKVAVRLCLEAAGERMLDGNDNAPVAPGVVELGEDVLFVDRATTTIDFRRTGKPHRWTSLRVADRAAFVANPGALRPRAPVFLGEAVGEPDGPFLPIRPVENDVSHLFPQWGVDGFGPLRALQAVPAPVGDDGCAFHVPRREGDPVLFAVNDAGPPVVLGALGGHCPDGFDKGDWGVHIGRNALFHGNLQVGGE